ncbi:hypothetical protein ANCDUO_01352 [Ancylostoma duodenale]|uniref:Cuticlin C-terminal domain-containing protein n=1 Tax=Ancylostoma duodenale TaxID=51022 RepID=A0A0C2H9K9_9BILA|nr:hypothetical protein ANCDUO_01352 [Ancylostoma duodenale]
MVSSYLIVFSQLTLDRWWSRIILTALADILVVEVSELTTAIVSGESEKPTCRYTLHKESPNGPLVKLAQVGDLIYHVWDCPSDVYGMMIHDCSIVDGQGNNHTVIDSQGCSTDTFLMPELMYSADLTRSFTPPRCGLLNTQDDALANDLNNDQLITSSTTESPTTSTTTPPVLITETATTTTSPTTTKVYTTVTELTSTSGEDVIYSNFLCCEHSSQMIPAPTTTATTLNATEFPTPNSLHDFLRNAEDITDNGIASLEDSVTDGSGIEIAHATPVSLIRADHIPEHAGDVVESDVVQLKREMRRREAEAIDVDITSPELTIIDKDIGEEGACFGCVTGFFLARRRDRGRERRSS